MANCIRERGGGWHEGFLVPGVKQGFGWFHGCRGKQTPNDTDLRYLLRKDWAAVQTIIFV
jgi:hypothetical protein